jgi:site-specific DNA-methyltransferase (cytosine-N4-specific)
MPKPNSGKPCFKTSAHVFEQRSPRGPGMEVSPQGRRAKRTRSIVSYGERDHRVLRHIDNSWDFREADTKYATHGIYRYPAMMVAPIVNRLIEEYSPDQRKVRLLDPFCGSGSALVEATLHGLESVGVDINPFAVLLARVKTTPIPPETLRSEFLQLLERWEGREGPKPAVDIPNLSYWYSKETVTDLTRLRAAVDATRIEPVRDFFRVCLGEVARYVSWTRKDEFKLFRMPDAKREAWHADVLASFVRVYLHNEERMSDFVSRVEKHSPLAEVALGDVRDPSQLQKGTYDLVVTSPPYGDSRTTVAYGQFSALSMGWIGFGRLESRSVDRRSLGGTSPDTLDVDLGSPTLASSLKQIAKKDVARAKDVLGFYVDLSVAFSTVSAALSDGAKACVVVGNRTVKGLRIETDVILAELLEARCGLEHTETIIRGIPNKVMPLRNSPSNVPGALGETMTREHILIFEKNQVNSRR